VGNTSLIPEFVRIGINILLLSVICFVIAFLSAKSYLLTGSLTLLIITVSFTYICLVTIIIGFIAITSPNWGVTLNGIDLLLFAALQLFSAYQASFRSVPIGSENRKNRLILAVSSTIFLGVLMASLTVLNVFPPFFINGVGVTLTDQIVFSVVIILFAANSALFLRLYLKSKSNVLYWYTLAMVLETIGSFGLTLQIRFSDIVVWTGRLGIYVATVYFLIALLITREPKNKV
jgi:hypothetical protein